MQKFAAGGKGENRGLPRKKFKREKVTGNRGARVNDQKGDYFGPWEQEGRGKDGGEKLRGMTTKAGRCSSG